MNLMTKITNEYLCPSHGLITGGGHGCGSCGKRGMRVASCGGCGAPVAFELKSWTFEPEDLQEPPREYCCAEATPDDPDHHVQGVVEALTPEDAAKAFTDGRDVHAGVVVEVRRLAAAVRVRVVAKTERSATREGTP